MHTFNIGFYKPLGTQSIEVLSHFSNYFLFKILNLKTKLSLGMEWNEENLTAVTLRSDKR